MFQKQLCTNIISIYLNSCHGFDPMIILFLGICLLLLCKYVYWMFLFYPPPWNKDGMPKYNFSNNANSDIKVVPSIDGLCPAFIALCIQKLWLTKHRDGRTQKLAAEWEGEALQSWSKKMFCVWSDMSSTPGENTISQKLISKNLWPPPSSDISPLIFFVGIN